MKIVSASFALVVVFALCGCPAEENKGGTAATAAATQSAPAAQPKPTTPAPPAPKPSAAPSGGW